MAQTYVTRDGDVLDAIVYQQYGTQSNGIVEQVLAANEGLADLGPIYARGVSIALPDITLPAATTGVSLWD